MEIRVIKNDVFNGNTTTTEKVLKVEEGKMYEVEGMKAEKKVPVRKWFRIVGHKFVMYRSTMLAIKPQSITADGVSFIISSETGIQPYGNFTMVKNEKKGDVYVLGKGESISFRTSTEKDYQEFILSIKE